MWRWLFDSVYSTTPDMETERHVARARHVLDLSICHAASA